ncbi:glutamate--tRNA ligase [Candidatus Woesearchaeota archaeon]|nr:glutamate--tRNA ligase [Candidatus Woesearchaeota archaeon]
MSLEQSIRKYVLQNAVRYNGKASSGAIMGKILGEDPELRKKGKEISAKIAQIVREVNKLSPDEQKKELAKIAPEAFESKKEEKDIFAFLGIKEGEKVITAFPPGPEKYPHIGHAKACILNYELAKKHNGKFLLRFEDTNPVTVKKEYYDIMLDNFSWLSIKWDELLYASDFLPLFYEKAEYLIKKGLAYVDKSSQEEIRESREKGEATSYRDKKADENLKCWKEMGKMEEGSSVLRLKIDLKHQNTTMRDPIIFRIVNAAHPRQWKYRVWPNYDFQNAIMDSHTGVTIRLRSKEFELRSELQRWIQEKLGMRITATYEFGRFNMEGVLSSGRIIREKVENGDLLGWDDPSLTTLVALRRRGFLPEAIKGFVMSTGISKAEATLTWDDLIMHNRRLLDQSANRYSAIFDPVPVKINGAKEMDVELHLNPNRKEGGRKFRVNENFILSSKDLSSISEGDSVRLMDCLNIVKKKEIILDSYSYKDFKGKRMLNWLPASGNVPIEVLMPDKKILKGVAEANISCLKEGSIVQFVRFGFCRLDKKEGMKFWFAHD